MLEMVLFIFEMLPATVCALLTSHTAPAFVFAHCSPGSKMYGIKLLTPSCAPRPNPCLGGNCRAAMRSDEWAGWEVMLK